MSDLGTPKPLLKVGKTEYGKYKIFVVVNFQIGFSSYV